MTPQELHELNNRVKEGRKTLKTGLPSVLARILAVRGHNTESMLKTAGYLMNRVYDYDRRHSYTDLLVDEVCYEELLDTLQAIEGRVDGVY